MGHHIFINPKSGAGKGQKLARCLSQYNPIIIDPIHIMEQVSTRVSAGETIIIAGGDGTISLVVGAIFEMGWDDKVTVAILPMGTGNDLAREIGISSSFHLDPVHFVNNLVEQPSIYYDIAVWKIGQRYFLNYVGIGMDGQILTMVDRMRKILPTKTIITRAAFGLAGFRYCAYQIKSKLLVKTDQQTLKLKGTAGLILSNISYYAGGCRLGKYNGSEPQLSVTVLSSPLDLGKILVSRFVGPQPILNYTLTSQAQIAGDRIPAQIDGDAVSFLEPCNITYAGKIKFLVNE